MSTSPESTAPAFGFIGLLLSLLLFGYWMLVFRGARASLREGYFLYLGLSLEVGLIVQCFQPGNNASMNLSAVALPAILCLVLLTTDDPPKPVQKRVLMRPRRKIVPSTNRDRHE